MESRRERRSVLPPASPVPERTREDAKRAERRKQRVERKLNELEGAEAAREGAREAGAENGHFDMIEFAENYFNNHEKSPEGEI